MVTFIRTTFKSTVIHKLTAAILIQGNTNFRPPMVANQIRPPGFPPIQNNQNRFNQNQGNNFNQNRGTNSNQNRGNNFYQGQVYQPPTSQPPVYQAQPYQAPAQQVQEYSSRSFLVSSKLISSGNPTPYYDPIVSTSSPTLTPFRDSDFLLFEEANSFLAIEDDPNSPKDLKICEANNEKSSVNEPPEVELKDLPPHLEYAFLEGNDKLPIIIAKDLKNEEKAALIEVLKSHKRAIAWKLSDIKGIDPEFYTHKILMEEDYEPTVQHQRRVNPKIHDVIKKEVEKLLDAGLIYPISTFQGYSYRAYCVPKKGGMTVVKNDENDLIPTRLVTGWRVCIDYRTHEMSYSKDQVPLPSWIKCSKYTLEINTIVPRCFLGFMFNSR
ncbi:hypothetical protein Tco_0097589 [Tanacetum coccineum]